MQAVAVIRSVTWSAQRLAAIRCCAASRCASASESSWSKARHARAPGKSTLLHVLGGLDRSFRAAMRLFGQELAQLSDQALSRLRNARIGFVFQSFHLFGPISCVGQRSSAHRRLAATLLLRRQSSNAAGLETRRSAQRSLAVASRLSCPAARSSRWRSRGPCFSAELLCGELPGNLDAHTGRRIISFRSLNGTA